MSKRIALIGILILAIFIGVVGYETPWSISTTIGWEGSFLCLAAFALLNAKVVDQGRPFQVCNAIAGVCMLIGAWEKANWSIVALECCWITIAVYGFIRPPNRNECKPPPA